MIQAQEKYYDHWLTLSLLSNDIGKFMVTLQDAQDEVDNKKETLLATVEAMLAQKIGQTKQPTIIGG